MTDPFSTDSTAGRARQHCAAAATSRSAAAVRYALLAGVGLVMLYPLIWLIGASFKTNAEIFASPGFWPTQPDRGRLYQGLADLDALHLRPLLLEHLPDHRCPR